MPKMDEGSSFAMYSTIVDRAIGFASREHEGQYRKNVSVPYIAHPMGVATILMQMGCRPEVIAAALLHDTVEDTDVTIQEIGERFGKEIADIVAGCTELPCRFFNWEDRKLDMIRKLRDASIEVKLVVAADKYHNLKHISKTKQKRGSAVWKHFGRGPEQQAWYYRTVFKSILENLPEFRRQHALFKQLETIIEELFRGIPSSPPQSLTQSLTSSR